MKAKRLLTLSLTAFVVTLVMVATATAADDNAGKEELKIELPKPMFIGTPKKLKTPNLEPAKKDPKRPPFFAPKGTVLLSRGKPVTGSDPEPVIGEMDQITDGDKEGVEGSYVEFGPGRQYVQIDLQQKAKINAIVLWHYHCNARVYHDVVIQTAGDPDFILDVKTVYNNDHDNSSGLGVGKDKEYIEDFQGRLMPVDGVEGRYLRFYSNGSTADELNHYTEIEVFGAAAK